MDLPCTPPQCPVMEGGGLFVRFLVWDVASGVVVGLAKRDKYGIPPFSRRNAISSPQAGEGILHQAAWLPGFVAS